MSDRRSKRTTSSRWSIGGHGATARSEYRVLVTYACDNGTRALYEGRGRTLAAALADADSQLAPGTWKRACVPSLATILADLDYSRRPEDRRQLASLYGEGRIVCA